MPKRSQAPKAGRVPAARAKTLSLPKQIAAIEHEDKRLHLPSGGDADFDGFPRPKKKYAYDAHLDPTLQWAGKAEHAAVKVDTTSLHIHQYISAQAILQAAKRENAQRTLFDEASKKPISFYEHEVGWSNRMILGDSLVVMNSLLERERLAGKVQCIYVDPPYGVKFNSNFQPSISKRDVKDADDASLTREPEQIQAFRDTWELGVHSYLTYLRDRLLMCRSLLADVGSIFVQISEDNLHHVRELLDEIFGAANFISIISFAKTSGTTSKYIPTTNDYLVWYGKDATKTKYRQLYLGKVSGGAGATAYTRVRLPDSTSRSMTSEERARPELLPDRATIYRLDNVTSQSTGRSKGAGAACWFPVSLGGRAFTPGERATWKTNEDGMKRLLAAERLESTGTGLYYVRYMDDFPAYPIANVWSDTGVAGFASDKRYVVETSTKVVERCVLMTTDPGDLVLDPTCGSGTTPFVAEQWGRRWITCDTSRVALALARQRLLAARFPYYRLRSTRVKDGFVYKTVPHITLKAIARNTALDSCKTRHEREQVIRQCAEQEILYDKPQEDASFVRVSGPFTVEAIPVASVREAVEDESPPSGRANARLSNPPADYLTMMIDLVRKTGVRFPSRRHLAMPSLRPVKGPYEYFHAEGESDMEGDPRRIAVSFGSQHAPVTPFQVRDAIAETRGYDIVLFIGFACDPEARRMMEAVRGREVQFVHAAPDILVNDLLKTKKTTSLFTVFGSPDVRLIRNGSKHHVSVELVGVDLYDPITGTTSHGRGEDVAAWFVDHDYDGRTFYIHQALFPGRSIKDPWEKLQKALRGTIDEETFETLRGTQSLPFEPGKRVGVTVIDDRGNEVIKVIDAER